MIATIRVEIQVREDGAFRLSMLTCSVPEDTVPTDVQRKAAADIAKNIAGIFDPGGGIFIEVDKPVSPETMQQITKRVDPSYEPPPTTPD